MEDTAAHRVWEVLVVEEEVAVRDCIAVVLHAHGFCVRQAGGGREAVEVYREHATTIDVVLLDVGMEGMDGPHSLRALRQINPAVRCCFMTGGASQYDNAMLQEMGVTRVFKKPFKVEGFVRILQDLARERTTKHFRWSRGLAGMGTGGDGFRDGDI